MVYVKKIIIFFLFLSFLFLLPIYVEGRGINMEMPDTRPKQYELYPIERVIDSNTLQLNDGRLIKLLGVDIEPGSETTKRLINDLISNSAKKIIVETDNTNLITSGELAYVYVWGIDPNKLPSYINTANIEYHGFLNVKDDILGGSRKGLAIFLNATIIKAGLAKVDIKQRFKLKEQFLKLQEKAQQNKIGLWENQ